MTIFQINKNTFAAGKKGKRADYVVRAKGKKVTGVRGQRPVLDARYKTTKANAAIRAALTEALA